MKPPMRQPFHLTFQKYAQEVEALYLAYETLPDSMSHDVANCFKKAYINRAHKLTTELRDEIDGNN